MFFLLCFLILFPCELPAESLNDTYRRLQVELKKKPDDSNLQMELAHLFSQGGEWKRAVEIYEDIFKRDPENHLAVTELCALYTDIHERKSAWKFCERAVVLDPKNYLTHDNLGLSYFKFGEFRKSLKPFLNALALNPKSVLVETHLAQVFLALRDYALARQYYKKLLLRTGSGAVEKSMVYYGLYMAEKGLRDYDHAFTAIKETYKLSGNPLFLGKMFSAYMLANQMFFFFLVGFAFLVTTNYLGRRLNRFLKNED